MQVSKDQILSLLQSRGARDQAIQADAQLPDQVDLERHRELLQQLGLDPKAIVGQSSGGLGATAGQGEAGGEQQVGHTRSRTPRT